MDQEFEEGWIPVWFPVGSASSIPCITSTFPSSSPSSISGTGLATSCGTTSTSSRKPRPQNNPTTPNSGISLQGFLERVPLTSQAIHRHPGQNAELGAKIFADVFLVVVLLAIAFLVSDKGLPSVALSLQDRSHGGDLRVNVKLAHSKLLPHALSDGSRPVFCFQIYVRLEKSDFFSQVVANELPSHGK